MQGAGFGGLAFCRQMKGAPVNLTLVGRQNHQVFHSLHNWLPAAGLACMGSLLPYAPFSGAKPIFMW